MRLFLLLLSTFGAFALSAFADTVYTQDGRELKGIVIEDYKDRILFSTVDGEMAIMKSDIRQLYFDSEEDNLIKLAEQAKDRKDFTSAFAYYDMALRANPNSNAAKEGLVFLQGYLFRKEQAKKEEEIRRREDFEERGKAVKETASRGWEESEKELRRIMGINIEEAEGPFPEVTDVLVGSPAYEAGMRKGDFLTAMWSKLTGYMSARDVIDMLLEKPSPEVKCTIQRTIDIRPDRAKGMMANMNDLMGASFNITLNGLAVSDIKEPGIAFDSGLRKDDIVVEINGKSTRYLEFKKAMDMIRHSREDIVKLTIRREVLIWRREAR